MTRKMDGKPLGREVVVVGTTAAVQQWWVVVAVVVSEMQKCRGVGRGI